MQRVPILHSFALKHKFHEETCTLSSLSKTNSILRLRGGTKRALRKYGLLRDRRGSYARTVLF